MHSVCNINVYMLEINIIEKLYRYYFIILAFLNIHPQQI